MVWWSCQTEKTRGEKTTGVAESRCTESTPRICCLSMYLPHSLCVGSILPKDITLMAASLAFILVGSSPLEKRKYLFSDISPKVTVCLVLDHVVFLSQSLRPLEHNATLGQGCIVAVKGVMGKGKWIMPAKATVAFWGQNQCRPESDLLWKTWAWRV